MKKAIILVNPYLSTESELHQPGRIREELAAFGVQAEITANQWIAGVGIPQNVAQDFDFCVYLDKDKYTPRLLEGTGMRLFNCAEAVELCDDKMLTHIALAEHKVPMPKTVPAPLCYKPSVPACGSEVPAQMLGYPVVVKECYGSFGQQVYLARDREELLQLGEKLKLRPHLYQAFVKESAGQDLRVICIGGRVIACMRRVSEKDFRSNIELGGRGEAYPVNKEIEALCARVTQALHLDYCGIDLLFGKEGLLVCEVNSNAFFGGIERVTGVNVARAYAEHIYREIYKKEQ